MFAIGPDFSAIAANPSGIGGYWKSEFLFSTAVSLQSYSAKLSGDSSREITDQFSHLRLPNLGFVIVNRYRNSNWISSNWAVGFNRMSDYNKEIIFQGNTLGSITDSWRENATGVQPDDLNGFEEGLAYTSGAIYDFEEDNIYETDYALNPQYRLYKQEDAVVEGGKSELFIGYGANLDQKLLIGMSVNLPLVNSSQTRTYEEFDGGDDGVEYFNNLTYTSSINTTGYGLNAKLGVTVKPNKYFNIAFALHSPTKLFLTDNFNTTVTYDYTVGTENSRIKSESPFGSFEYALRTPWSATGGIGIIAGEYGFIGASVKWTDYGSMKFDYSVRGNGDSYEQEEREVNADIRASYGSAIDLNLGGEVVADQFRFRAGVMLSQSAFNNDDSFDPTYAGGIGYRGENFFVDLAYSLHKEDEGYLPYETIDAPQPLAIVKNTKHRIAATVGLKF